MQFVVRQGTTLENGDVRRRPGFFPGLGLSLFVLCATLAAASGSGRADISDADVAKDIAWAQTTPSELNQPAGTLLRYRPVPVGAFYKARAWRILYVTRDYKNQPIASTGLALLPNNANPNPARRKIIAWAHETAGVGSQCAPSIQLPPKVAINGFNAVVPLGDVIAATDYPGLGTTGTVGYLVGSGQAYAIIDSVRAVRQIPEIGGSRDYGIWGYSQGAQGGLFANEIAETYAPELRLVAVAMAAPPTNLVKLFKEVANTLQGRIFITMTLVSWQKQFHLSLSSLLTAQTQKIVQNVKKDCLSSLPGLLGLVRTQGELPKNYLRKDPTLTEPWASLLRENSIFMTRVKRPLLITQGLNDKIVYESVTDVFVRKSCKAGVPIEYIKIEKASHSQTGFHTGPIAMHWLHERLRGVPVAGRCHFTTIPLPRHNRSRYSDFN